LPFFRIMGRLKPGTTSAQVEGNLGGAFQQAAREGMAAYLAALPPQERRSSSNQNRTQAFVSC
jgi:hypothetical protein